MLVLEQRYSWLTDRQRSRETLDAKLQALSASPLTGVLAGLPGWAGAGSGIRPSGGVRAPRTTRVDGASQRVPAERHVLAKDISRTRAFPTAIQSCA